MNLSAVLKILEAECFTHICIEVCHAAFTDCEELKLSPDQYLHHSTFCRQKKLSDHNRSCSQNKKRSLKVAVYGRAFCGTCPFGVKELVQPVIFRGKLAAVCYFSILPETIANRLLFEKAKWLDDFIHISLTAYSMNQTIKRNSEENYRKRFLYYLDLHYTENIGANNLADALGINYTYFSSLFRKVMGKTFRQTLTERRIHEAKIYLKLHTKMSISHIAHLCGFSDSNYFSLVFHRLTGFSPKDFRNRSGENE